MPAFEDDLRLTREARSQTLAQIQQETRIPVDVLKRFEDGHLVGDATYNEVYLRAFLRSYARALGVPQGDVLAAYDRHRQGTYRGELNPGYDPATAPPPPPPTAPSEAGDSPAVPADSLPASPPPRRPPPPVSPAAPPTRVPAASPVDALREGPPVSRPPIVVPTRVARPGVRGARRSYDKNWTSILALTGAVIAALAFALYFLVFRGGDEPEADAVAGVAAEVDSAAVGAGAAGGGPQLQLPFQVVVTAAGDGLQSFAVSTNGSRAPYWITSGDSRTFTADSSLILWGEGSGAYFSDATVELQGIRWTPPDGRPVTISRETGQRLLDSLSAAGGVPALAPDSAGAPAP
ncbi:MAG TPA: helix-turn-helix transcriptional regulator [Rubricoccaceae bacterium]